MNIKKIFAGLLTAAVAASAMLIPSSAAKVYTANLFISDSQWIGQYWEAGDSANTLNDCVKNVTLKGDGQYTVSLDVSKGFTKEGISYSDLKELAVLGVSIADAGSWKNAKITIDKLTVDGATLAVSGAESRVDENNSLRADLFNSMVTPKVNAISGTVGTFSNLSITFTVTGMPDPADDGTTTTTPATSAADDSDATTTTAGSAPTGVEDATGVILLGVIALGGAFIARKGRKEEIDG